ncbi:DNA primase [Rhodoblastus acidophilus]|uniref:DNA primase n=1 Tax=Candidatus Rhodoblastus alkanivorans TaxID=2954117 RepID=A0ABS9ZAB8_9HYPH|nr:DNA primase [Candidatus Rhodoblastus alkanivorans]MCI4677862.1 DNA primase [Candidatus Rhodoblastus alkanivorans]MCI4684639.1 DNA primase [Candidatus Rhodoblastus alkanivorans]MDI4641961.1 DNA primase [Rhodoblastus acidophilus]
MKFPPSFLDEIRARLPMSEVAGQVVRLKKDGREWKGLSPFNAEKTPSFYVNDQKGAFFDFSAGKNGDIFHFVMETQGLGFPEAVEKLAAMAGVPMPVETPEARAEEKRRATALEALEMAADFFERQLRGAAGARARAYLTERGLNAEAREKFRLGFAPSEKFALRDFLAGKGCLAETMIEAGLLTHGPDIAVPYDFFRDRLMFPICDRSGRVIAFGGRALAKDIQPKYKNTAETPLFHKGRNLYNLHNARKAAHERGTVVAVEGYVDVISLDSAGFSHAVAGLGTALTPEQCELLWKMAEEPILCFDGDRAGRKAAFRALETALPLIAPGRSLRFALLPEGQDPDDLARAGGRDAVKTVLDQAKPLVEMLFLREVEAQPLDTPERRAGLERRLREAAGQIRDESLRRHYLDDLRERLAVLFGRGRPAGFSRGARFARESGRRGPLAVSSALLQTNLFAAPREAPAPRENLILALLLNHPGLVARHSEEIARLEFVGASGERLRDALLGLAEPDHSPHDLRALLAARGFGAQIEALARDATISTLWCARPDAHEDDADYSLSQALTLHRRQRELNRELRQAETLLARDPSEANNAILADIRAQLSALEGVEAMIEGFGARSGREDKSV